MGNGGVMYQLKKMLNDLVEYTFKDDPRLKAYKSFTIEILDKNFKSKLGDYRGDTRHIRIMNTYRDENKLIVTAVHELAHHVNHMQGNEDIHGKGFYANYEKLLHGALDMKLITKSEWMTIFSAFFVRKGSPERHVHRHAMCDHRRVFPFFPDDAGRHTRVCF